MENLAQCSKEKLRDSLGYEVDEARKRYEFVSSYSACTVLLANAMREQNQKEIIHLDFRCYKEGLKTLFKTFNKMEHIHAKLLEGVVTEEDRIFWLGENVLLRIRSYYGKHSYLMDYALIRFKECKGKFYTERCYHRDPYYCEEYYENKEAFGLFDGNQLITGPYVADKNLYVYTNYDVRDYLENMPLDEIYQRITKVKEDYPLIL